MKSINKKYFGITAGIVLSALLGLLITNNTKATNTFTVSVDPILEINLSSNIIELNLTPKPNTPAFSTTDLTITAGTNNLTGYQLFMDIDNPNLTRTGSAPNGTTPTINSLAPNAEGYTESTFTTNSWGYRIGTGNYQSIPDTELFLGYSPEPANEDTTTITFASKVDMEQLGGTYTTDIILRAVTNIPTPTMQDIDTWRGALAENQSMKVIDARDNKLYWVLKAKDGNIWMTQNLDFDIDSTKTYTPADTDLTANWTPIRSTIPSSSIASNGAIPGWINDANTPYSLDPGVWFYTDTWSPSSDCPSTDGNNYAGCNYLNGNANGKFSQTPYPGNGSHGHVGNYYNWSAAVAMNDTSSYTTSTYDNPNNSPQTSICPAGWRLPTISSISNRNEFQNLLNSYNAYINSGTEQDKKMQASPLFFVRGGVSATGSLSQVGNYGFYYSNTIYSNDRQYTLRFNSNELEPMGVHYGGQGFSVRCLARPVATITFNANGGEGTMAAQTIKEKSSDKTLSTNTFTRDGYIFTGWNTRTDGTGTSYINGANYDGASTTLYAQWKELPAGGTFERTFYDAGKSTITVNGNEYYKMQDMSASICSETGDTETAELADTRDNNIYSIAKLGSYCWMTKNLRLARGTTVTPDDTNTNTNWTVPQTDFDNGGWVDPRTKVSSSGEYWYNLCATAVGKSCGDIGGGWTPTYDICPKGWRLPVNAEYNTLTNYVSQFLPVAGGYYQSSEGSSTLKSPEVGRWWSKEAWGSLHWYVLQYNSSNNALGIYGSDYHNKQNKAYFVRCIAK